MEQQITQFLLNHSALWLALLGILVIMALNEGITKRRSPKTLSVTAAVQCMNHDQAVVIDLRDKEIFRAGHLIGALCISAEELPRLIKYKKSLLILVCPRGLQSTALAVKLRKEGFTQPMVLGGGMNAWQAAHLPVVKGKQGDPSIRNN